MNKIIINTKIIKGIQSIIGNKKEHTEACKSIYFLNGFLYATNGKIALKISIEKLTGDIKQGKAYKILSISKENSVLSSVILEELDIQYPDIEKIFSCFTYREEEAIKINVENDLNISRTIIVLYEKTKNAYNYKYLQNLSIIDNIWNAFNIGQDKFVFLKSSDNIQALIMPFL